MKRAKPFTIDVLLKGLCSLHCGPPAERGGGSERYHDVSSDYSNDWYREQYGDAPAASWANRKMAGMFFIHLQR